MYNISDLIPKYKKLNETYIKTLLNQKLDFEDQRFIFDFNVQFIDLQLFEYSIIELIKNLEKENLELLLIKLNEEINTNISLYNENKSFFDNIKLNEVCKRHYNSKDDIIAFQAAIHKEAYENHLKTEKTLREAKAEDKDNSQTVHNHYRDIWEKEKNEHFRLLEIKKELEKETYKYHSNAFGKNNKLSNSFLIILDNYLPTKKDHNTKNSSYPQLFSTEYFDYGITSAIHKKCNNIEFENISKIDFYNFINLSGLSSQLEIKKSKIKRAYYVLFKYSISIADDSRREYWIDTILEKLGKNKKNYLSRYKEIVSDNATSEDLKYAHDLDEIFKKYTI